MSAEILKRTPLFELAQRAGASFTKVDGWLLADDFPGAPDAAQMGALQVGLADRSARAKVLVEGMAAAAVVERAWDLPPLPVNRGALLPLGAAFRLRHDRVFLSGTPAAGQALTSLVETAVQAQDGLITITGVTHGRAELWLLGRAAAGLLSRLCGLDLHPDQFPNLAAQQTSVAKTAQLVIRADVGRQPVYRLVGPRSLGAYLWQTIATAAHDMDLQFCGEASLQALEAQGEPNAGP